MMTDSQAAFAWTITIGLCVAMFILTIWSR
jgi:hypothetical protein